MSKRPLQARYAESAAQTIYDLRDCIRVNETELYAKLDETAQWLSSLGARFEDDGTLRPAPAQAQVEPEQPKACNHSDAIRDCAGGGWRCECGKTGVGTSVEAPAPDVERALAILRELTCEGSLAGYEHKLHEAIRALGGTL